MLCDKRRDWCDDVASRSGRLEGRSMTTTIESSTFAEALAREAWQSAARLSPNVSHDDTDAPLLTPPRAIPAMFYGLVGDVAKTAATGTEVNPVAAAGFFLTVISAAVGRDIYLSVGNSFHHARIFGVHVGRTAIGRKGDAQGLGRRVRAKVCESFDMGHFHSGGLSSREGLAGAIQDPQGEDSDGTDDKRLLIVESEFSNTLAQGKREGNTLTAALRDAWDGNDIKPLVKHSPTHCTDPHIAIWANITPPELRGMMTDRDVSNGFLNRFLFVWAERTQLVPLPLRTSDGVIDDLAERTQEIVSWALGDYPTTKNTRRMTLSSEAESLYVASYPKLCDGEAPTKVATLLERAAPYSLRLAMLFAITDQSLTIERHHLHAALAWVAYAGESVAYIFGSDEENRAHRERCEYSEKLMVFLAAQSEKRASRTEIVNRCFSGHIGRSKLDDLLKSLAADQKIVVEFEGERGKGKTPKTIVRLAC
jgi:hypothetical protein